MATLHIWGAFEDLPSIDAECIAILAYIAYNRHDINTITTSYDPSSSPNGDFPLLITGDQKYAGYSAIIQHLVQTRQSLSGAPPTSQTDIQAWTSFIRHRGQQLLDLSHYVSSENYWNATSPAWTKILPWYANYLIPPAKRSAAIERTKHLGVRSLNLDSIDEYATGNGDDADARITGQPSSTRGATFAGASNVMTNPEELIKKQKSVKWLQRQQHSDTFQLYQLTKSFFGPLEELLGEKKYLLSDDEVTSLDCVAYGYLSLMGKEMPQPWLRNALRTRFGKLSAYIERLRDELGIESLKSRMVEQAPPSVGYSAMALGQGVLDWAFPSLRTSITLDSTVDRESFTKTTTAQSSSVLSSLRSPTVLLPIGAVAGIAFGIAKYISLSEDAGISKHSTFHAEEHDFMTPTTVYDLGESGAMLSALGNAFDQEAQLQREKERAGGAPIVEVDVDVANEKGEVERDVVFKK